MPAAASGGVTPLNITIRVTTTGTSTAIRGMSAVTRGASSMGAGLSASTISARTLGDAMRQTASLMKYTVAGAFMNIGKQAIQMQRQFELSFSRIKGLVVVTGDSLNIMKERVMSLAGETTRAPLELADALYYITSAGIKETNTALEVLESSAKAAAAGLGTTNTVADAVTSTMNAYGAENYSAAKATDILVATVREGKAEADTFAPALGKVLPVAAAYGASFEDVSAAIAALSRGGLSAGTAAIYVRQTLSQLLKPSKQAIEVLKGVGTSAEEIRDNVQKKGLFPALMELRDQLDGIENASDFTKVFGNVRALTAVLSLVGPAAEENAGVFERMNNSFGDLDYAFEQYADTLDAQFNRALAEQQAALIEVGQAIQPIVTEILKLGTSIAKAFKSFAGSDFGGAFIRIAAGATIAVAVFASVLKTSSALVRLFSTMQISLFGTQLKYDATTGAVYRYTHGTMMASTATGAMPVKIGMWTAANGFLATSLKLVAGAMHGLTRAMGTLIPILSVVLLLLPVLTWAFGKFKGMFDKDPPRRFGDEISKVNELLNETTKYARSGIDFDVNFSTSGSAREQAISAARNEINQQSPEFLQDFRDMVAEEGHAAGSAYIKSLMETKFAGNTQEFKDTVTELLIREGQIDRDEFAKAILPELTKDAVSDAISFQGLVDVAQIGLDQSEFMKGFNPALEGTEGFFKRLVDTAQYHARYFEDEGAAYGNAFSEGIQKTQQLNPLIANITELQGVLEASNVGVDRQGQILQSIIGGAFQGLEGTYELIGDKSNALRNLFMLKGNQTAARDFIASTFDVEGAEVDAILKKLQIAMRPIPKTAEGAAQALTAFNSILAEETVDSVKETDNALQILPGTLTDVAERFSQGLHPEVQQAVTDFDAATAAIKEFERGQKGLMGSALAITETQIDFRDAIRGIADAGKDAGGSLLGGSEAADKAKGAFIKSMEATLDAANALAAAGEDDKARAAFAQGYSMIVAEGIAQGFSQADILAFFDENKFNADLVNTFAGAGDATAEKAKEIGKRATEGLAAGVDAGTPYIIKAVGTASDALIEELKKRLAISSPSKRTAKEIGDPAAEGVAMGFAKGMRKYSSVMGKSLNSAIDNAYKKGGRKGANKFFKDFLERKENVESPAADFVKETIGRMKDIIGSLGDYIKSQLNFRRAQSDLAKLINMQRGLDDRRRKAARETQYAETRFGRGGGAEVTGYEQAQLDQLQLDFERVSRDYAMGRATYVDLVDAEIALFEARQAASEINDDVIDSQNKFIDATVEVENRELSLAEATVNVLSSYQDVQEAAAQLYINHTELAKVYNSLAEATGIASGKIVIGSKDMSTLGGDVSKLGGFVSTVGGYVSTLGNDVNITKLSFDSNFFGENGIFKTLEKTGTNADLMTKSIGASFTNMAAGLLDPNSDMYKHLASLGPSVFKAIQTAAQDALDKSPLNLTVRVNATVDTSGGGGGKKGDNIPTLGDTKPMTMSQWQAQNQSSILRAMGIGSQYGGAGTTTLLSNPQTRAAFNRTAQDMYKQYLATFPKRAIGGPVTEKTPYMVGERGPEMFVPNVSGTIVTNSALERYTRTRPSRSETQQGAAANNIVVTVNNPVPEAAEDSITRRMKVLANSGLFG